MTEQVATEQVSLQSADADFVRAVEDTLTRTPRQLPTRYLYDALGSALFEAICELPWYPVTQAELGLLAAHGRAIFAHSTPLSRIVELGPGSGAKLLTLVEAGRNGRVPADWQMVLHLIDVSAKALEQSSRTLAAQGDVRIVRHEATYERGLASVSREPAGAGRTLVLFLGSNLGNFDRPSAETFLRAIRRSLRPGDDLLVGADLVKPEADLLLAYDDPLGVTAAFNRNLLLRVNRELGGDFDLHGFDHRAVWNREQSRVEMHLVSRRRQRVRIAAAELEFTMDQGETIWTETSYKYDPGELTVLLERVGFEPIESWTAAAERFALALVRAV